MITALIGGFVLFTLVVLAHALVVAGRRVAVASVGVSTFAMRWSSSGGRSAVATHPPGRGRTVHRVTHLAKYEAEDLLDWLEATRKGKGAVSYTEGRGFTVTWS